MFPCGTRGWLKIIANPRDALNLLNECSLPFLLLSHICIDLSTELCNLLRLMLDSKLWTPRHHQIALPLASSVHISMPFHSPSQKYIFLWRFRGSLRRWRNLNIKQHCRLRCTFEQSLCSAPCFALFLSLTVIWPTLGKLCFPGEMIGVSLEWVQVFKCPFHWGRGLFCFWWGYKTGAGESLAEGGCHPTVWCCSSIMCYGCHLQIFTVMYHGSWARSVLSTVRHTQVCKIHQPCLHLGC